MSQGENSALDVSELRTLVVAGAPRLLSDFAGLIRIPSVSWEGFEQAHMETSAARVADLFESTGLFSHVGVYRHGEGAPAVIARREPVGDAPTVVLYAHHDVQPPGDNTQWESPAFEPSMRAGRLYGRGSADDKAGIALHLGALRALASHYADDLRLGVVVFIEGEEENGSPSFAGFLNEHRELLQGDVIIVADSDNPSTETPALTVSLRGNVTATLRVRTLNHAVHSGMFGGALPDAMMAFSALAASFYDTEGGLAIAGLEGRAPSEPGEQVEAGPDSPLAQGVSEVGHGSLPQRLWRSAALTITGMDIPSVTHASNTLLPEVSAKVSLRVPPGMASATALAALDAHIAAHIPFGAHWELRDVSLGEPFSLDPSAPALDLAAQALSEGFGAKAVYQGVGGSIPFISQLAEVFPNAQILVTGIEDPDTRAHSPNESLDLSVLWRALVSEALLLAELNRREISDLARDRALD
ncbi:MAG: M20/M25/M40 family metallo-hydrolase [Pontimonas sp.]|nr:M20/M25/M40 family metallo-hydrolase [Pontimonas sp.]